MTVEAEPKNQLAHIAIVGTGISGLETAYLLAKSGQGCIGSLTLFDRQSQLGGVLVSTRRAGYTLEHGAQAVIDTHPHFKRCVSEIRLTSQLLFSSPESRSRYLMTPNSIVPIRIFALIKNKIISFWDIIRFFCEIFAFKPVKQLPQESVYSFFARHFGEKFAHKFIVPLCHGIWAGGAQTIPVRLAFPKVYDLEKRNGSLLRSMIKALFRKKVQKKLASFPAGMAQLVHTLWQNIQDECKKNNIECHLLSNTNVTTLIYQKNTLSLKYQQTESLRCEDEEKQTLTFDSIVLACQPWQTPQLEVYEATGLAHTALQKLMSLPTHSIAVVGLGGELSSLPQPSIQGFGALAGSWSPDILGVLFIHSLFPQHVPKNSFLYRVFLGGEREKNIEKFSKEKLLKIAQNHLLKVGLLNPQTPFDFTEVVVWPKAIAVMGTQHDEFMAARWQLEGLLSGLFLTGNYIDGVGVEDCLRNAKETADKVLNYIS